jgi:hypothetical protein
MTMRHAHIHRVEFEGRRERGNSTREEMPVFDKRRAVDANPAARIGLAAHSGTSSYESRGFLFRRDAKDNRPGTPVPWGEPHPDRLALSEERRRILQEQDEKYMLPQNHKLRGAGATPFSDKHNPQNRSKTIDIDEPVNPYIACPDDDVLVSCTRGGRTLQFSSVNKAALCLVGNNKYSTTKAIQNAATGIVRQAFGWTWTRHRSGRGKR